MKINSLRYLDRKIGIPICNALYCLKRGLFLHGRHKFNSAQVKNILVIKIWGVGSIISASPVFQNLRDNFPDAKIIFLTKKGMENIYPTKFFDRIITINLNGLFSEIIKFIALIIDFRQQQFDLVIDLEIASRYSAILSYLCGAKTKVGFEIIGQNKDRLYDYKSVYHESKHITKIFLGTLSSLGLRLNDYAPFPPEWSLNHERGVRELLIANGIVGDYVVVNINASELAYERRLPLLSYKLIVDNIKERFPSMSVLLVGSEQEKGFVTNFHENNFSQDKKIYNISGKLRLAELFVLLKNAKLVISNDSGPAHIAASFNAPLIVFFGPETPVIYRPFGDRVSVFSADVYCSPCISVYKDKEVRCHNNQRCLRDIDLNKVNECVINYLSINNS